MELFGRRERFGSDLGLERISLVCQALGNPEEHLNFIHIAGTNGKGSVAVLLAEVLQKSGFKTGLFTSPHLENYRERFRINGVTLQEDLLKRCGKEAEQAIAGVERDYPQWGPVTEFELATVVSFLCFRLLQADVVVLETGLGGRLDATNVVDPLLTVITTIGHDHTNRLGTTLAEIAREKGGTIKRGVPVISGVKRSQGADVLRTMAALKCAPWHSVADLSWDNLGWGLNGGSLFFPGWGKVAIGLLGDHQLENAATALLALRELSALGWPITAEAVREGMAGARWPGRLELLRRDPLLLLDGSHNPEGIAALALSLKQLQAQLGTGGFTFVFGILENKDPGLMDPLLPLAEKLIFTAADSGRFGPKDPQVLKSYALKKGVPAEACPQAAAALKRALQGGPVCVCGSLYLVGTIKRILRDRSVIVE